jgi:hypothetical protein
MNRRDFITTSLLASGSLLMPSSSFPDLGIGGMDYEDAVRRSKYRQHYLDELLEAKRESYPYITSLEYVMDPVAFGMRKEETLKETCTDAEYERRIQNFNIERMKRKWSTIDFYAPEICTVSGKDVFVLPSAFDLGVDELDSVVHYRNGWCEDIVNGIVLGGEAFDHTMLNPELLELLISLRSTYGTLGYIYSEKNWESGHFKEMFSDTFVKSLMMTHEVYYISLRSAIQRNTFATEYQAVLRPYEEDVVRRHLQELDEWVSPQSRFTDPRIVNT